MRARFKAVFHRQIETLIGSVAERIGELQIPECGIRSGAVHEPLVGVVDGTDACGLATHIIGLDKESQRQRALESEAPLLHIGKRVAHRKRADMYVPQIQSGRVEEIRREALLQ